MKFIILSMALMASTVSVSSSSEALLTEKGDPIVNETGSRLLIEDGRKLNLEAYVKSKSAKIEYKQDRSAAVIKLPLKNEIEIIRKQPDLWTLSGSTANIAGLFNVWSIDLSVLKSIPRAEVSIEGCGQTFKTNGKGAGSALFYVDATPSKHAIRVKKLERQELTTTLEVNSSIRATCDGTKELHCIAKQN